MRRRRRISDDVIIGLVWGALFFAFGLWLTSQDFIFPDSMSRVANGYYVIFSRDPHLAAIGFVWNPAPSLLVIPVLLLSPILPVLTAKAFAGVIVSVIAGALSMVLARRILVEFGVPRGWTMVLTSALAIQPLILISSATGASEALLLVAGLYVTLSLLRWISQGDPWFLVHTGLGLGGAYLVRYEAAAAALIVTIVVLALSLHRSRGRQDFKGVAILDAVLVSAPFGAAFLGWALISRVVVGSWFATYESQYGNSAQVTSARHTIDAVTGGGLDGILGYLGTQLFLVAPLAVPLVVASWVVALIKRDARVLAAAAALGAILAFDEIVFINGSSFGWLRFQIMAIPWGILSAGYLLGIVTATARPGLRRLAAALLSISLVAPLPLAWRASLDPLLAREEVLAIDAGRHGQYVMQGEAAAYIDSLNLPDGSVITDVAYSFPIVLASRKPRQFVITPDRDFQDKLADPVSQGVRYALVTSPDISTADAVTDQFPNIYEDGGGVSTLDQEWVDGRGTRWRLYAFNQ